MEQLRAEKIDVARKSTVGLIGGVAVAGGAEWQNLPPVLFHCRECLDPTEGFGTEVADAERSR